MARFSSHVLDALTGADAIGVRMQLFRLDSAASRTLVFDRQADGEGRIAETLDLDDGGGEFELCFHTGEYFSSLPVNSVVFRVTLDDDARRYHFPLILSPHSCAAWWSG